MDEHEICGNCRFWAPIWKLESKVEEKKSKRGGCHRYAPHSSALTQSWPVTQGEDWCGDFESTKKTDP